MKTALLATLTASLVASLTLVSEAARAETELVVTCDLTTSQADYAADWGEDCTPSGDPDLTGDTSYKLSPGESVMVKVKCFVDGDSEANDEIYPQNKSTSGGATCYELACVGDGNGFMDCGFSCTNWDIEDKYVHIDSVTCSDA